MNLPRTRSPRQGAGGTMTRVLRSWLIGGVRFACFAVVVRIIAVGGFDLGEPPPFFAGFVAAILWILHEQISKEAR